MRSRWTTVTVFVLSAFVILIAVGQLFFAGGEKLKYETAYIYSMEEEVPFDGVYLRDETLIYGSGTGILSYEYEDGSRVGKSSVIAGRYKSESEIDYRREIEELKEQIEVLNRAEELIGTDNSQLEAISGQINEQHSALINCIVGGDYTAAAALHNSFLEVMCKREITLQESTGYSEKIAALRTRISELEALVSGDIQWIYAGGSGYCVSKVDGYEGELGFSDIDSLTEKRINDIVANPEKGGANAVGKLISDYIWRVAAVIDTEKMFGIYAGSKVMLRVGSDSSLLEAEVVSVENCGDGKSIYVFQCDRLTSAVVQGRTAHFKLVISSYGGLRVSRGAIRYNDEGERGVYIVRGTSLAFKKINVLYWGEDYVICSQEAGEDYLKLYDRIVTEGKELYEGKVVE